MVKTMIQYLVFYIIWGVIWPALWSEYISKSTRTTKIKEHSLKVAE